MFAKYVETFEFVKKVKTFHLFPEFFVYLRQREAFLSQIKYFHSAGKTH